MTETELKLRDAATQMRILLKSDKSDDILRSCVNAFISHARSVTYVMQRESAEHPTLKEWYEERQKDLLVDPLMRFFNEKRTYSIHRGVITPKRSVLPIYNLKIGNVPQLGNATMTIIAFDGVKEYLPKSSGNMYRLCEEYYIKLKALVKEWLSIRAKMGV